MTQTHESDVRNRTFFGLRYGAWAGIAFVLVLAAFLVLVLSEAPTGDADVGAVRRWFADSGDLWRRFTLLLTIAQFFLLVPFAAAFTELVTQDAPDRRVWAWLSFTGLVIAVVVGVVADLFWGVLSLGTIEALSDEMLTAWLRAYNWAVFVLFQPALGLWGFAAGIAILAGGGFPRWQGWLSLALVIPHLASATWILDGTLTSAHDAAGVIGTIGHFGIWLPAVALSMLRRHRIASNRRPRGT